MKEDRLKFTYNWPTGTEAVQEYIKFEFDRLDRFIISHVVHFVSGFPSLLLVEIC